MFNFDGKAAKILTISGGRIMVDFNNPLAGKEVIYKLKIKRKIDDINEKIKALLNFFFRKEIDFEIKDNKIILNIEPNLKKFVELFKDKFKEIFKMELEIKQAKEEENEKTKPEAKTNKKAQ